MKNDEENFLEQLLNETYKDTKSEEQPIPAIELFKYFQKKLNEVNHNSLPDYLEGHNLNSTKLSYVESLRCYRMNINEQVIDFPENWSFFNELGSADYIYINKDHNEDMILDLFGAIIGKDVELLVVKAETQVWFVYLDLDEDKDHLEWVRTYRDKINNLEQKKAA